MFKNFKDNLFLVFVIVGIAMAFLLGKSCNENKEANILKPVVITTTQYRDTIFPKDTIYENKWYPSKPKHDTVWVPLDSVDCNKVVMYEDTFKKPEYEIYARTNVQGILRDLTLGVKLKVPLIIKDSVIIKKDSIFFYPSKYSVCVGVIASPKTLAPSIMFSKNRSIYTIGYDPFNKQPVIGYSYRLWGSKK